MPDPIYFQWQNEYLLRSIYPLRELKLRDFLLYFYEIDIWQKYKDKTVQSIASEVQAFRAAKKVKIFETYDRYQQLEAYLLDEDVSDTYRSAFPNLDAAIMVQINEVHKNFKRYFPSYKNPLKEKYFATERVRQMEELQKKIRTQISEKQRILRNNGPAWANKAAYENEVKRLETISLKMVEQELSQLVSFVGAYERLYQNKIAAQKQKAAREKELLEGARKLQLLRTEEETLQPRLSTVQATLQRLKNPPNLAALKAYFLDDDVSDLYRQKIGDPLTAAPLPVVLGNINEAHRSFKTFFPTYNNAVKEKYFISQRLTDFGKLRTIKQQELATAVHLNNAANIAVLKKSLQMLDEELGKLTDFAWAYENQGKPASLFSGQIAQAEKEQLDIQTKMRAIQQNITAQETALAQEKAAISISDKDMILASIDAEVVKVQDIVRDRVEDYKNSLMKKDLKQLLEAVVQEFMHSPTRYPLWLQYMVIHFSGMRYQSAHGSWADPKDMLLSLRSRAIEQKLKRAGEDAIKLMSEERFLFYQSAGAAPLLDGGAQAKIPALALAKDAYWKRRVEQHLKALDPAKWFNKFKALLDLEIDEEDYEIQQLTDAQALSQLEDMKDQLPDWMWNEIVRSTNLRMTQVKQPGWEQLTEEERQQRYAEGMGPYREILEKWKKEHLTAWREEHERSIQLNVTRAVCNEVAEHIQHIRGRKPSGGLTAKPEWYLRNEKDPRLARVPDKPFFGKPQAASDFRPGASIFWLNWVNKEPNIWQIARPISLRSGEELIQPLKDAQNEITNTGSAYQRRTRFVEKDAQGRTIERQSQQWLRWNHEATVVEVAETVDGPTVLTFETALPGEDRRQSTIGVFKRYVSDLKYNVTASQMNGTFVGYIPEGAVPYDDLREMLDWNRVLLRSAYTPAEIEQFWQKVTKPIDPSIAFAAEIFYPETAVEVAPQLSQQQHKEWALCYEIDPGTHALALYQPAVELKRGTRLLVTKDLGEQFNSQTGYPVTRCDYEPRAEGLYLRAEELVDAPEETSIRPAKARKEIALYRLLCADEMMKPVFEESAVRLKAGTKFLLSTVHTVRPTGPGNGTSLPDGAIRGKGRQRYSLIIACPDVPEAEGLFVRRGEQRKTGRAKS